MVGLAAPSTVSNSPTPHLPAPTSVPTFMPERVPGHVSLTGPAPILLGAKDTEKQGTCQEFSWVGAEWSNLYCCVTVKQFFRHLPTSLPSCQNQLGSTTVLPKSPIESYPPSCPFIPDRCLCCSSQHRRSSCKSTLGISHPNLISDLVR